MHIDLLIAPVVFVGVTRREQIESCIPVGDGKAQALFHEQNARAGLFVAEIIGEDVPGDTVTANG